MLSKLFLSMSLLGAEWVLYILILLSILSLALIFERIFFYRAATNGLDDFRKSLKAAVEADDTAKALSLALERRKSSSSNGLDLETEVSVVLLDPKLKGSPYESFQELSQSALLRIKTQWEKNLTWLATIGNNAPFIGLFGTVLGIIQAFHDLSQKADGGAGASSVTAGISDALVATAVGIMVAIPAVVAFNLLQRRVRTAMNDAESMRSYLIGHLTKGRK